MPHHKKLVIFFLVLVSSLVYLFTAYAQQADRIYAITFNYQREANILSLAEIREAVGSVDENSAGGSYQLKVLSADDDVLHSLYFNVEGQRGNPEIVEFSVFVPYFENADHINVYDKDNNPVLSVSLQDAINTKPGFRQLSPLSQEQQNAGSSSETPLLPGDKTNSSFNLKWLYVAAPIVLIAGFLFFVELRRKKDHARLVSNIQTQKTGTLKSYVSTNLRKGYTKEQIRSALIKNNYNNQEIEEAFRRVK